MLRVQLNKKAMDDTKISVREVGEWLIMHFLGDLNVIFTDDHAMAPVVRIRLLKEDLPRERDRDFSWEGLRKRDDAELTLLWAMIYG